jgi:hypothetical protein
MAVCCAELGDKPLARLLLESSLRVVPPAHEPLVRENLSRLGVGPGLCQSRHESTRGDQGKKVCALCSKDVPDGVIACPACGNSRFAYAANCNDRSSKSGSNYSDRASTDLPFLFADGPLFGSRNNSWVDNAGGAAQITCMGCYKRTPLPKKDAPWGSALICVNCKRPLIPILFK